MKLLSNYVWYTDIIPSNLLGKEFMAVKKEGGGKRHS